ncbi:MAG TPA: aromatic ring-hydroxylating dioxygenase subunit alpha [Anaerolineaceae bacterium]
MIRNQWYIVLESSEVKPGKPVGVVRMGERLVFWRTASGTLICMRDQCPHLGAQLSQGKCQQDALACPFHGFEFDAGGQCRLIPALGAKGEVPKAVRAETYRIQEAHGLVYLWWGDPKPEAELPPLPYFDDLDDSFSCMSFQQPWSTFYSRIVENQLDVMHLPFVHYNTIGRGGRKVVDGPLVRLENDTLSLWVYNRLDDGTPVRKAEELPPPTRPPFLIFKFPNFWQNRISEDYRLTVAFVPVDQENSILYGRVYQRMVKVPLLRELVNWISVLSSKYIANQDRVIVTRQRPKVTHLKMGEKIMPGDRAILTYRRRRYELMKQAGQSVD